VIDDEQGAAVQRTESSAFFKPQDVTPAGPGAQPSSRISIIQARLPRPW
jgi:hypothetical protein